MKNKKKQGVAAFAVITAAVSASIISGTLFNGGNAYADETHRVTWSMNPQSANYMEGIFFNIEGHSVCTENLECYADLVNGQSYTAKIMPFYSYRINDTKYQAQHDKINISPAGKDEITFTPNLTDANMNLSSIFEAESDYVFGHDRLSSPNYEHFDMEHSYVWSDYYKVMDCVNDSSDDDGISVNETPGNSCDTTDFKDFNFKRAKLLMKNFAYPSESGVVDRGEIEYAIHLVHGDGANEAKFEDILDAVDLKQEDWEKTYVFEVEALVARPKISSLTFVGVTEAMQNSNFYKNSNNWYDKLDASLLNEIRGTVKIKKDSFPAGSSIRFVYKNKSGKYLTAPLKAVYNETDSYNIEPYVIPEKDGTTLKQVSDAYFEIEKGEKVTMADIEKKIGAQSKDGWEMGYILGDSVTLPERDQRREVKAFDFVAQNLGKTVIQMTDLDFDTNVLTQKFVVIDVVEKKTVEDDPTNPTEKPTLKPGNNDVPSSGKEDKAKNPNTAAFNPVIMLPVISAFLGVGAIIARRFMKR